MRFASFSFALALTPAQVQVAQRHNGAARFAYNQGVAFLQDAYARHKADTTVKVPYSGFDLINAFNRWKVSATAGVDAQGNAGLAWRHEVLAQVFEEALVDLSRGVKLYFEALKEKRRNVGFPRFKKKGRAKLSFRVRNSQNQVKVGIDSIVLPKLGAMRVCESTRKLRRLLRPGADGQPRAKIRFATVSCTAGRWFVRINIEAPAFHPAQQHPDDKAHDAVGIDRGLRSFVVAGTADATVVCQSLAPKPLKSRMRALKRLGRRTQYKKQRDSRASAKARHKLAVLHARVARIRKHYVHNLSTQLVKTHAHLALEDLNIGGMVKNRCLARSIMDAGWGVFARQVTYKATWYNAKVTVVDRFFPSSKRCNRCHWQDAAFSLRDEWFHCASCGLSMHRDINASANLAQFANDVAAKHAETKNVCGEESADRGRKASVKLASMKQKRPRGRTPEKGAVESIVNGL